MKIQEIMSKDPASCMPEDDVEVAAGIMRRIDTGIVPVVAGMNQPARLLGVVTDRDLCLGVVGQGKERTSVRVGELMSTTLAVCTPGDTAEQALTRMRRAKVRRLPVVNRNLELIGIVSLADIVRSQAVKNSEIIKTLTAICAPAKAKRAVARKAA